MFHLGESASCERGDSDENKRDCDFADDEYGSCAFLKASYPAPAFRVECVVEIEAEALIKLRASKDTGRLKEYLD